MSHEFSYLLCMNDEQSVLLTFCSYLNVLKLLIRFHRIELLAVDCVLPDDVLG